MSSVPGSDLAALKTQFDRDGCVVARGMFSSAEVAELIAAFEGIHHSGESEKLHSDQITDPKDPLTHWPRVVHPHRFNATARRHMLHPAVRETLAAFFDGVEPLAAQTMYYFKPPGARGQALHQDNLYLLVQPGTCVGAWTAMDICDEQNGCMLVVPGSHRGNLVCNQLDADTKEYFNSNHVPVPKGMKVVPVCMQPGDTLFFHGNLIHGSGPNRHPTRFRRSFIGHYAAGSLKEISKFYLPLVRFDDAMDIEVPAAVGGGACGETWQGAEH
ncbi:MAG: phytanoyl-CoA dioxygenase family protein [Verrucomicrobia bacterium]|nr:phytanoyl-CoA dioxygenase family protein [Verrucomicrobiota bacterium]